MSREDMGETQQLGEHVREMLRHRMNPQPESGDGGLVGAGERLTQSVMRQSGLLGVVLLIVLIGGGYIGYRVGEATLNQHGEHSEAFNGLASQLAVIASGQAGLSKALGALRGDNAKLRRELESVGDELDSLKDELAIANRLREYQRNFRAPNNTFNPAESPRQR